MGKIIPLGKKAIKALKKGGVKETAKRTLQYIETAKEKKQLAKQGDKCFKDVLFINGCDYNALPHPPRYRVKHQMEQLMACHVSCDEVFYNHINLDQVRNYRTFIIFRCPYNDEIGEFVRVAQSLNKRVIYDIDDLVIDTKYTDTIKYLSTMSAEDRAAYDVGVEGMHKLLCMCDAVITTTEGMADELKNYVPEVFINRNTASEEMVMLSEKAYASSCTGRDRSKVKLGYFSGSITHNDDFLMIQSVIIKLMEEYPQVELHIAGILDIPQEMQRFKERVIAHPFVDWRKLPKLIASIDINLAPIEDSIFNRAKSENKWVEAALVRVPTVASNVGAFAQMIGSGENGILCLDQEEWYFALKTLIEDEEKREKISHAAYEFCMQHCVTVRSGENLERFIRDFQSPNIAFILPSLNISGGIMVALEHARILRKHGMEVSIINIDLDRRRWCQFQGIDFPVLIAEGCSFEGKIDRAVATMWVTVNFLEQQKNVSEKFYLVQNLETNFYAANDPFREDARKTYCMGADIQYLTISKWCQKWLEEDYGQTARYVPNGIHTEHFYPVKRKFEGKIRILIEGDCSARHKNVDESFEITNQLDPEKFEIWYMSYNATPKEWYRIDKFLHKIPYEKVADVYRECHILLKTSILESFSYPPLEMMATGGYTVVVPNEGNREYLIDGENCLLYPQGSVEQGLECIYRICKDEKLREILYNKGQETALQHEWDQLEERIVKFYNFR